MNMTTYSDYYMVSRGNLSIYQAMALQLASESIYLYCECLNMWHDYRITLAR